jgi:hypothetical protein
MPVLYVACVSAKNVNWRMSGEGGAGERKVLEKGFVQCQCRTRMTRISGVFTFCGLSLCQGMMNDR